MALRTEVMSGKFAWRRVHSLMGLWLVFYLIFHLVVNSQAALWLDRDWIGFIDLVDLLESLPYLHVVEIVFIGVPLLLHAVWGVHRALTAKSNVKSYDNTSPSLPFRRNQAFSFQRLTSWILLIGILGHVLQMRFIYFPREVRVDNQVWYTTVVQTDPELKNAAYRTGVLLENVGDKLVVKARSPGKAMIFMLRETFKNPFWCVTYSIFVLAAAFHAFNGFWTALITWGVMLSYRSQRACLPLCWLGVALLAFLGLAAIWGSYWL